MKNDQINIGILGLGNISTRIHLPLFQEDPFVNVYAAYDLDLEKGMRAAKEWKIPNLLTGQGEIYSMPEIDLILIATPNSNHAVQLIEGLKAGKDIMCEKPAITSTSDIEPILNLIENSNSTVFVCFTNRFRPEINYLKAKLKQGMLGEITAIKLGWLRKNGIPGIGSWFTNSKVSGGGVMTDLGCHLVDLAFYLLPSVPDEEIVISGKTTIKKNLHQQSNAEWYQKSNDIKINNFLNIESSAHAFLRIGELEIDIDVAWDREEISEDVSFIEVSGTKGNAELKTLFGLSPNGTRSTKPLNIKLFRNNKNIKPLFAESTNPLVPYKNQLKYFLSLIKRNFKTSEMLKDAMKNAIIIEGVYKSARDNKTCTIKLPF